jgi:hypothetical protein
MLKKELSSSCCGLGSDQKENKLMDGTGFNLDLAACLDSGYTAPVISQNEANA